MGTSQMTTQWAGGLVFNGAKWLKWFEKLIGASAWGGEDGGGRVDGKGL